ncbi:MAG: hypothetical protein H6581_28090 [Bacteroidia bacterium]|nr:hypothetical protein [Bacteroidia bacterium]
MATRLRAGLFFEQNFQVGNLDSLAVELACHAIDEYIDGNCTRLEILVSKDHFTLSYDAGMSLKEVSEGKTQAESIFLDMMVCSNLKKHLEVGQMYCRIGMMKINAVSLWSEVTTVSGGEMGVFSFKEGALVSRKISPSQSPDFTRIRLAPDPRIFPGLKFTLEGVRALALELQGELPGLEIGVTEGSDQGFAGE